MDIKFDSLLKKLSSCQHQSQRNIATTIIPFFVSDVCEYVVPTMNFSELSTFILSATEGVIVK